MGDATRLTAALTDVDGMGFHVEMPTGHTLVLDADASAGGGDNGPRPVQLLLAALIGCTGMDVISILRKMQQPVEGYGLRVEAERAEEHPRVYTRIKVTHVVRGDVDEERLRRAIELSETKYCSVHAMLEGKAEIETAYEITR